MRRARITYKGAYHHVMNRGIMGADIFLGDKAKYYFLECMEGKSKKLKIRIFGYCIMNNHYHIILENSSGKLSEFMKQLNGQYGVYYRRSMGGKGYVFQSRFKSTLIEKDNYLRMAIIYILLNPVRAGMVKNPYDYRWSSIGEYFAKGGSTFIDNEFVEGLVGNRGKLKKLMMEWISKDLPIKKTRIGDIIGTDEFLFDSIRKFERRRKKRTSMNMRVREYQFKPINKIIRDFEREKGVKLEDINVEVYHGKRLRGELLVLLKEEGGLTYKEIIKLPIFQSLKYSSLGYLYKRTRKRTRK
ncbi:transposase [candidate division WOR-3 bacterium]|nr:transposase [candidate division WOR-3 bacterium]